MLLDGVSAACARFWPLWILMCSHANMSLYRKKNPFNVLISIYYLKINEFLGGPRNVWLKDLPLTTGI